MPKVEALHLRSSATNRGAGVRPVVGNGLIAGVHEVLSMSVQAGKSRCKCRSDDKCKGKHVIDFKSSEPPIINTSVFTVSGPMAGIKPEKLNHSLTVLIHMPVMHVPRGCSCCGSCRGPVGSNALCNIIWLCLYAMRLC